MNGKEPALDKRLVKFDYDALSVFVSAIGSDNADATEYSEIMTARARNVF